MKNKGSHDNNREDELPQDGLSLPKGVLAVGGIVCALFGMFCVTVSAFSGGAIRVEGPLGVRLEAHLGDQPTHDKESPKEPPSDNHK
jgi:hypothetical protein